MKVRCLNCGFAYEIEGTGEEMCPECGCRHWSTKMKEPEEDSSMVSLAKEFLRVVKEEGIKIVKQEDLIRDPFKEQREFQYRIKRKEEGLAFEIIDIKDGNKVRVRKIYLNGHIEGFKGDPLVTNHIAPKIMALKGLLQQMNKDYRYFIERHLLADLPINPIEFSKFYQLQLERIMNIVPTI